MVCVSYISILFSIDNPPPLSGSRVCVVNVCLLLDALLFVLFGRSNGSFYVVFMFGFCGCCYYQYYYPGSLVLLDKQQASSFSLWLAKKSATLPVRYKDNEKWGEIHVSEDIT